MQNVNLYQPIASVDASPPPLTLRVITKRQPVYTQQGSVEGTMKAETYVLLSALPIELQERVKLAIQTMLSGG